MLIQIGLFPKLFLSVARVNNKCMDPSFKSQCYSPCKLRGVWYELIIYTNNYNADICYSDKNYSIEETRPYMYIRISDTASIEKRVIRLDKIRKCMFLKENLTINFTRLTHT